MSLKIQNIEFAYRWRKPLFSSFSAEISPGRITALLGSNGTGKTSLLKLCCGLLIPGKGHIEAEGYKVSGRHKKALEQLFFVPDSFSLPAITAKKYGEITGCFYKNYDQASYNSLLERLQVPADKNMGSLSFGQQKKVGLALAFAVNTSYLLLDEPTNGLDPQSMESLKRIIAESGASERSIIISTHHLRDVENLCDDFMILDDQHRLSHRSIQDIMSLYYFAVSATAPENCLYSEETFGNTYHISPLNGRTQDSQFNLPLYMNAILSGSLTSN